MLSHSRFLLWASEIIRQDNPKPFFAPNLATAVPRVTLDEYRENLCELSRIAQSAGARLILLGPPVNLYWRPARIEAFPGWEKWEAFYQSIEELMNHGGQAEAWDKVNVAVFENPDNFLRLVDQGNGLDASGRHAGRTGVAGTVAGPQLVS